MTAEELIDGLRERGYVVRRSLGPGWVIVPRLKPEDPMAEWLGARGANMRAFQPERWTHPEKREYEAVLSTIPVDVEPVLDDDGKEDKHRTTAVRQLALWEAAAP